MASSWLSNFGHGMVVTVVGPTQPYLALNVGVDIDTINLVWTFGFLGFTLGAIGTGLVFRRFCTTPKSKMMFLWSSMFLNGAIMITLPFIKNFPALVIARGIQNICLGAYITADTRKETFENEIDNVTFMFTLRSLINVQSLIAVQGVTFFYKKFKVSSGLGLFPFLRP